MITMRVLGLEVRARCTRKAGSPQAPDVTPPAFKSSPTSIRSSVSGWNVARGMAPRCPVPQYMEDYEELMSAMASGSGEIPTFGRNTLRCPRAVKSCRGGFTANGNSKPTMLGSAGPRRIGRLSRVWGMSSVRT